MQNLQVTRKQSRRDVFQAAVIVANKRFVEQKQLPTMSQLF